MNSAVSSGYFNRQTSKALYEAREVSTSPATPAFLLGITGTSLREV